MNIVNKEATGNTPLTELMALDFVCSELLLYLDTHASDMEATDLFNQYVEQYTDALQQYERQFGALTQMGAALNGQYEWLSDPWPWDFEQNKEA